MSQAEATAFAPATVANVAVGFDILGFPIDRVGDKVSLKRTAATGVIIKKISGIKESLPLDAKKNTASVGLLKMQRDLKLDFGFEMTIEKGIPLGSGMGGSAASAVAALVAANSFLPKPLTKEELLQYALLGEQVASGSAHPDNVAPCLFGGLSFTRSMEPVEVISLPVPKQILCVLVHPHTRLDTRESRAALSKYVSLKDHVQQSIHLVGFVSGCFKNDLQLIQSSLEDVLVEPQRAHLIPGFSEVKKSALAAGAMGCSISGSGPSVFAWSTSVPQADKIRTAMLGAFSAAGLSADAWISPIAQEGARLIS